MVLKRMGPMSVAKVSGALYGLIGLVAGVFIALLSMVGGALAPNEAPAGLGLFLGVGAIIVVPVFYGVMGFVGGLVGAGLYNWMAGMVGGIELQLE